MGLINKTKVTDNLSIIIGHQSIDVIKKESFPFEIQIRFVKVSDKQLDSEQETPIFTPTYRMAFMAIPNNNDLSFTNTEEIKQFSKALKEVKDLFEFAKDNKDNWFETALFEGVLLERVGGN